MRHRLALAALLGLTLAACSQGQGLVVLQITASPVIENVQSVQIQVSVGTTTKDVTQPLTGAPVELDDTPRTIGIVVPLSLGKHVEVTVNALDENQMVLGSSALVATDVSAGKQVPLAVVIGPPQTTTPDGGTDDMSLSSMGDLSQICAVTDKHCDGTMLATCNAEGTGFDEVACAIGCTDTPSSHCKTIVPSTPATIADFTTTGLTNQSLSNVVLNGETGEMKVAGVTVRAANAVAATFQVVSGIGFHVVTQSGSAPSVGIWTFSRLDADGVWSVTGANAIALVSAGDINLKAELDAYGGAGCTTTNASAGGAVGGTGTNSGGGLGGGAHGGGAYGGGGAGYGDVGGAGAPGFSGSGGGGGVSWGTATNVPLVGGSGGGGCGHMNTVLGGAGGGAVQLVANGTLTVGNGANNGGVNVGGCGGQGSSGADCGAGGGSGGAILIEASNVAVLGNGRLAADGGGGGAADSSAAFCNGTSGGLSGPGLGGMTSDGSAYAGGIGGDVNHPSGYTSTNHPSEGSGGGGAVGRIRVNTINAPTFATGSIISPAEGAHGTLTTQ